MKFSQCKYLIECDLHAINNGGDCPKSQTFLSENRESTSGLA